MNESHTCAKRGNVINPVGDVVRGAQRQIQTELGADDVSHGLGDELVNFSGYASGSVMGDRMGICEWLRRQECEAAS